MSKGPKVHPDIEKEMVCLVSHNPYLQASEIETYLSEEFRGRGIPLPSLRTIQDRAKRIRDRLTIQEKPWSLAAMTEQRSDIPDEEVDIPWEASRFIMQSIIDLKSRIKSDKEKLEELWPYSFKTLTFVKDEPIQPEDARLLRVLLTNRQAKWLWRLHLILPNEKPVNLLRHADAYVQRELLRDYLGWEFDTSDLENSLMNILRSQQQTMKSKTKEE